MGRGMLRRRMAVLCAAAVAVGVVLGAPGTAPRAQAATAVVPNVPTFLQTVANSTTPSLSGVVSGPTGDVVNGEIFLETASGTPIDGAPTALGAVQNGERVTWDVPSGVLSLGTTYEWYMEACYSTDTSVCSAPSAVQTFNTPTGIHSNYVIGGQLPPSGSKSLTISGSALSSEDAIADSGACSGADCAVQRGSTLTVGAAADSTGTTRHWVSALKASLASIPAGSQIYSAKLNLTQLSPAACTAACASDTLDVYAAGSDVAAETTGPALLADAETDENAAGSAATSATSVDITPLVAGWSAGVIPDNGLILETATESTDTSGWFYPSTSASTGAPTITVVYVPPAVSAAPTGVTATAGDGGAVVSWTPPTNTGYIDPTTDGLTGFSVETLNSAGTVVATTAATSDYAVITGLTDGSAYTFAVAATNPEGTSAYTDSAQVTPAALTQSSTYVAASSQFLNGRDALEMGSTPVVQAQSAGDSQAQVASAALTGDAQAAMVSPMLTSQYATENSIHSQMAAAGETESADSTTLANSVAVPGSGGTVTVYTTGTEQFTTVDTSAGGSVSTPGTSIENYALSYNSSGTLTGYYDADAILNTVTAGSGNADAPALDPTGVTTPSPLATDSTSGLLTTGSSDLPAAGAGLVAGPEATSPNRNSIANWANKNWNNGGVDMFSDNCTNFVSLALNRGGGMPLKINFLDWGIPGHHSGDTHWYINIISAWLGIESWSNSWSVAQNLAYFELNQHATWLRYSNQITPGDVLMVDWSGGNFNNLNHSAIVSVVVNGNPYVDQHSNMRYREPVYKIPGKLTWQGANPHLAYWAVVPYEN